MKESLIVQDSQFPGAPSSPYLFPVISLLLTLESLQLNRVLKAANTPLMSIAWAQQGLTLAAFAFSANTESIPFCSSKSFSNSSCPISDLHHLPQSFLQRRQSSRRRASSSSLGCRLRGRRSNASSGIVTAALARAEPVFTPEVEKLLETIKWDNKGLVVAIAQHVDTGAIFMQGFANREAIAATITSNHATFFSRSRSSLWTKGESSKNFINVVDVYLDFLRIRLFTWELLMGLLATLVPRHVIIHPLLILKAAVLRPLQLEATIAQRKAEVSAKPSWTKKLVGNPELLCSEIREEADELCRTVQEIKGRERTISEMADLLYHTMVLLAVQDVKVREVLEVLRGRFSKSGIEEKNNRSTKS